MTGPLGGLAQWAACVALAGGAVASVRGRERAALLLCRAGAGAAALAVTLLGWALATGDFTLAYVAATTDRTATWPYRLAGLWGAMGGSLLLWTAMVAAWSVRRRLAPGERAVLAGVAAAVVGVGASLASPWDRLARPALDGEGLTPILEHPAMLVHPPLLYLGLTGLAVPFARTVGARTLDAGWVAAVRRQLLAAGAAVVAGMAIGAHWAYAEVGWGGFYAWDPVENTALLPLLAALTALHLLPRRQRGAVDPEDPPTTAPDSVGVVVGPVRLAAAATVAAFLLALVGGVLTRSGAAPSVHAFAEDGAVGWALGAVTAATASVAAVAVVTRRRPPAAPARRRPLAADVAAGSLAGALAVVLLGTVRPLVGDTAVAVDGSYYARLIGPVAIAAAAVLVASGAWRRRGVLAHVGFLVLLAGVLGSTTGSSLSATVAAGEAVEVGGWTVRNDGVEVVDERTVQATVVLLRGDDERATLRPSVVAHPERGGLLAETALRSTPLGDVLVALRDADDDGRALLEVHVRPLVWWVWWGAGLVALGLAVERGRPRYDTLDRAAAQSETSSSRSLSPSTP